MNSNYEDVINAIKKTINSQQASLHEPNFCETDYKYLKDCMIQFCFYSRKLC